jgi:hypothetical protein|tara:strand:+ start:2765 stop:3379 length:615 start_codon:yes stop_codon:yes gene_type:complete
LTEQSNKLELPFSQSCENNKGPILEKIRTIFSNNKHVLEIASGTGQHAIFFSKKLPHLSWQPTEIPSQIKSLNSRLSTSQNENLLPAIELDVDQKEWGIQKTEAIFTANSLHIMSEKSVENLIFEASQKLSSDGQLIVYGPFKYEQRFTSVSNADFDSRLRDKSDYSAIRDFEWINSLCKSKGLLLKKDFTMPANNRLLLFKKI